MLCGLGVDSAARRDDRTMALAVRMSLASEDVFAQHSIVRLKQHLPSGSSTLRIFSFQVCARRGDWPFSKMLSWTRVLCIVIFSFKKLRAKGFLICDFHKYADVRSSGCASKISLWSLRLD